MSHTCATCKKPHDGLDGFKRHPACREKSAKLVRRRITARRHQNLCPRCGFSRDSAGVECAHCRDRANGQVAARKAAALAKGKCAHCKRKPLAAHSKYHCLDCLEEFRLRHAADRKMYRAQRAARVEPVSQVS